MLAKKIKTKIAIRPFRLDDLEAVMDIEPSAFGEHHWSRQSFVAELNKPEGLYFVAHEPSEKKLLGYSGFWMIGEEGHITTLAVHPEYRGQYIGERLLVNNILAARGCGALWLTLEVRASNEPAQKLYSKYGFKTVNIRPRYYQDNFEDALILWSDNITKPEFDAIFRERSAELTKKEEEFADFSRS
jgi:ribosomal-protein-alanine N-acetyltransferase